MKADKKQLTLAAAMIGLGLMSEAQAAQWINVNGGNWATTGNWDTGNVPDTSSEDASINSAGTYTVTTDNAASFFVAGNITIGTTSASGVQTLRQSDSGGFNFSGMTVGQRGVYQQDYNQGNTGTAGTITIQNGGTYRSAANGVRAISHNLTLDAGGVLELRDGGGLTIGIGTHTFNAAVSGNGVLRTNGPSVAIGGTGTIGGNGVFDITNAVTFTDNLTITRSSVATGWTGLKNNVTLTIDGSWSQAGGTRSFGAQNNSETGTVTGAGAISIVANSSSSTGLRFGGANGSNNGGGTLNFAGSGSLSLSATTGGFLEVTAEFLNLQRDVTMSSSDTGYLRLGGSTAVTIKGADNTLALNPGRVLMPADSGSTRGTLSISEGAEILLAGGNMEFRKGTSVPSSVNVGIVSAGTVRLAAGTRSSLSKAASGTGGDPVLLLGENATVVAEADSVLALRDSKFRVDMQDPSKWGLATAGAIEVGSNNVYLEALSNDAGTAVDMSLLGFRLQELRFADAGANIVLNLAENTNNDGGSADAALYVGTLDLSALPTGRTLDLNGLSGAERVYFGQIVNPNNVSFVNTNEWAQVVPEPAALSAIGLSLVALCRRQRRA